MLIKSKRKDGKSMHWWFENALFVLVTFCIFFLDHHRVTAQTYCEDKPKILFYRRGQAALVSGGDASENNNHVVVSNVNKEFLACVSSRNVEWTYDGEGEPSKFQESSTVDIQKYEDGSISYCLTSQITFSNKQSDTELSRHTGRYSCREIGNISNAVSAYVFASKKNSPTFLQSRKTITLPLSQSNITTYPILPSPVAVTTAAEGSSDAKAIETQVFTIPCLTTHPNVTAKLLKKDKNNKFMVYTGGILLFDPKLGFLVNASNKNTEDLSEFYGEYKCLSSASSRKGHAMVRVESPNREMDVDDFVFITIVKAKSFQIYPPVHEVYTAGMLNLTCESDEPVIMKEVLPHSAQDVYSYLDDDDYGRDRSDDIVETTERNDQTSHIANYMEIAPAPGRSGEIQCLTEKDSKVLHTWRYRVIRKRADKLSGIKFNKREKSFTCKSKLGSPGRLSFISCRTPSECRINRICLTKAENCRGYSNSTRAFCERKTHFCGKIFYKGGSGLIRCIGEGIDEIRGFTDEASADHAVRMGYGKLKASETALLQLAGVTAKDSKDGHVEQLQKQQTQKGNGKVVGASTIYEGDQVNVTLQMGYYYFLYPVQWAAKFRNGSTAQINPDSQYLQVEKLSRTVHASLTLPYTAATTFIKNSTDNAGKNSTESADVAQPSEIIALHALIPLRASVDPSWKTISLALTVFGCTTATLHDSSHYQRKKDLQQPFPDIESEEVLVEQPLYQQTHANSTTSAASASNDYETAATASENEENDEDAEDEADPEQTDDIPLRESFKNETVELPGQLEETHNSPANASIPKPEINDGSNKQTNESRGEASVEKETERVSTRNITTDSSIPVDKSNESDVVRPIEESVGLNNTNISEKPLTSLGERISFDVYNVPDHGTDAASRDTKIKEANNNDDAEWMIVERNQADETLFLARSGLLFDDKDAESSENADGENDDTATKRDDDVTTEFSSVVVVNVANDEIKDANTENVFASDVAETTTTSTIAE